MNPKLSVIISSNDEEAMTLASSLPKKGAGRRVFKETRHPIYRGVRLRNKNKWVCETRVPNNKTLRIWLGTHATPEMAARAHDVAALALRGKSACLNFADSAWRLTLPESTDAVEIRRAAMVAAEMFSAENNNLRRKQQSVIVVDDCEVCINVVEVEEDEVIVMEDVDQALQDQGIYTELEDLQDLLLSIGDEPRDGSYYYSQWNDVGTVEPHVSLWDFST